MSQEDIYAIWRGLVLKNARGGSCNFQSAAIELASIVAAAERRECSQICNDAAANLSELHDEEVLDAARNVCINLSRKIEARGEPK